MINIIVDKNYKKYSPLFSLSNIDLFEVNLKKYKTVYIFIDNMRLFYYKKLEFPCNTIFVIDKNIVFNLDNINIKIVDCDFDYNYNIKDKIIKHQFIKDFINV